MKYSNLIFAFAIVCAVRGQNLPHGEEENGKFGYYWKSQVENNPRNEERAKEEKIPRDFIHSGPIESVLIDFLNPKPIVDTASRRELNLVSPGNNGYILGDLVVRGSNAVSRVINSLGPPKKTIQLSKSTMETLNQLGTFISGL